MPEKPFAGAARIVEEWLADAGAPFVRRTKVRPGSRQPMSWELDVDHPCLGGHPVRLVLPEDFPATPAQVYVDKSLCLALPHVEETGKVCLGAASSARDYGNPIGGIERVVLAFQEFLHHCLDADWVAEEFQREAYSYWLRFCEARSSRPGAPKTPKRVWVSLGTLGEYEVGTVATYTVGSGTNRSSLVIGCFGADDPHTLASRHGYGGGTLVRGKAIFLRLPTSQPWTPAVWPLTFAALDELTGRLSGKPGVLKEVLAAATGNHPSFVFLVQGGLVCGYQLFHAQAKALGVPTIEPVLVHRIDPSWALTRGYEANAFEARRRRRVLVLGCGSLGSPLVELLARAGVGNLVLVDSETFEPENCSRHILGMSAAHQSKAAKLATRLNLEIPGANVKGLCAFAGSWVSENVRPGDFDLVVDCTGDSSVRAMLHQCRAVSLGNCEVVHAWVEPFCAAAHVVFVVGADTWPLDDPADELVHAARWPEEGMMEVPACGAAFHPYGAADVWQAAGFSAERVLSVIDGSVSESSIWSWVRSSAYFDVLSVRAEVRALVPRGGSRFDATMVTRRFRDVVTPDV
jgi:hypothetical protein